MGKNQCTYEFMCTGWTREQSREHRMSCHTRGNQCLHAFLKATLIDVAGLDLPHPDLRASHPSPSFNPVEAGVSVVHLVYHHLIRVNVQPTSFLVGLPAWWCLPHPAKKNLGQEGKILAAIILDTNKTETKVMMDW